ncbi:MAG: hypothetical protein NZ942_01135 [Candidatus Aenigmarchaeota archaeon]|nr:hypothetical protein [Candidatus Aenigmarchaeota archaeon]
MLNMLTEFEKTILLSLFVLAKGSTKKHISLEELLSKFPIRQRKMVKEYVTKLEKEKYLARVDDKFKIEKKALSIISQFLVKGPKLRV